MKTIHSLRPVLFVLVSLAAAACSAATQSSLQPTSGAYLDARLERIGMSDRALSPMTGPTDARVSRR